MSEASRRERAKRVRGLYLLVDDDPRWGSDPVSQARAGLAGGAAVVQLRAKHAPDREALAWAEAIRALAATHRALFVVNDRFDLALAAEADGVHLGQSDLPPDRIPASARDRLLVGRSTHTLEHVRAACSEPVDYLAFGPVFDTTSKASPYASRGLVQLAEAARLAAPRPLVAIGGIDAVQVGPVLAAGAAAVAVISAVAGATDAEAAARTLAQAAASAGGC